MTDLYNINSHFLILPLGKNEYLAFLLLLLLLLLLLSLLLLLLLVFNFMRLYEALEIEVTAGCC